MRRKFLGFLAAALALGLVVACAPGAAPTPTPAKPGPAVKPVTPKPEVPTPKPEVKPPAPTFSWKLSTWGPPRAWTRPVEWWSKEMEKGTGGRFKLEIVYGEGLAKSTEQLDGIKAGAFEMASVCGAYHPAKNPLYTVLDLPFFPPAEVEALGRLDLALQEHPAIKEEFKKWSAMPILSGAMGPYNLMGKKKITKVEDFKGARIRLTGEAGKLLQEFGAVPTLMPAPEIYTALDKGMVDMVAFPWTYGFYDYKLHEISKYGIDKLVIGTAPCLWVVNLDAWNKLPPDFQKLGLQLREGHLKEWVRGFKEADGTNYDLFRKAGVEIIDFPAGERAKLVAAAEKYWKAWVEDKEKKGLSGKAVFDFGQTKIKELEKK